MKNWPRLTATLPHAAHPAMCAACGTASKVTIWMEHDDDDKPDRKFVALCLACADKIIESHERLYSAVAEHTPMPGIMTLCLLCRFRVGLACASPEAKFNGGTGINVTVAQPVTAFMDGSDPKTRRRKGWIERFYPSAPTACSGRKFIPQSP